ncbi:MAG: response regulator [Pseudomonadota bacterium]
MGKSPHTILLVDDEINILNSLMRALHGENHIVLVAENAGDALGILQTTPVDLIISDIGMPGMNGLELLSVVKERHSSVARIVLTGNNEAATVIKAVNEGEVYRFLTKPWDNEELRICIRHTLRHFDFLRNVWKMMNKLNEQERLIRDLEARHPGITQDAGDDVYVISDEYFSESIEDRMKEYLAEAIGVSGPEEKGGIRSRE